MVDTLLANIGKRFRTTLEDEECQLAAAFLPGFHFIWLDEYGNTKAVKVRKSMEAMRQQSDDVSSNTEKEEDDFLSSVTQLKESSRNHKPLKDKT